MASLKAQVGSLIRHHRVRRGLTQTQLADLSDRSPDMINRVERGVTAPSFDTLDAFATVLETPVRDFFGADACEVRSGRNDALGRLINRVSGLDEADLDWIDRLVALALNRKVRRPTATK